MNPTETVHRTKGRLMREYATIDIAASAEIVLDGTGAEIFLSTLYLDWVSRIDEAEAWELLGDEGFGLDFDDRIDLRTELANSAVDSLWHRHIGGSGLIVHDDDAVRAIYCELTGSMFDHTVDEIIGSFDDGLVGITERMAMALVIACEKFLDQLHGEACAVANKQRELAGAVAIADLEADGYSDVAVIPYAEGRERFVNPDLSNFDNDDEEEFMPCTSRQARIAELEEYEVEELAQMIYDLEVEREVVIEVTNGVAVATDWPEGSGV